MTTNVTVKYEGKGGQERTGNKEVEATGTNRTWKKVRRGARKREREWLLAWLTHRAPVPSAEITKPKEGEDCPRVPTLQSHR